MRSRMARVVVVLALVASTGVVFAGSGLACASLAGRQAMSTVDMCFLFDCQNGAIGGLIDPCSSSLFEDPLFTDCPDVTPDDTGGGDGGGGGTGGGGAGG